MGSYSGSSPRLWLGPLSVPRWHFPSEKKLCHQLRCFFRCDHLKNQLIGFNQVSSRHRWLWLFWVKISSRTRSSLKRKWLSSIEKLLKWLVTSRTSVFTTLKPWILRRTRAVGETSKLYQRAHPLLTSLSILSRAMICLFSVLHQPYYHKYVLL